MASEQVNQISNIKMFYAILKTCKHRVILQDTQKKAIGFINVVKIKIIIQKCSDEKTEQKQKYLKFKASQFAQAWKIALNHENSKTCE